MNSRIVNHPTFTCADSCDPNALYFNEANSVACKGRPAHWTRIGERWVDGFRFEVWSGGALPFPSSSECGANR